METNLNADEKKTGNSSLKQEEVKIDKKDIKEFKCPKCKGNLFTLVYRILLISKLLPLNTTGKDIIKPMPHFKCVNKKCGHILKGLKQYE